MQKAAIDKGNTRCKIGVFSEKGELLKIQYTDTFAQALEFLATENITQAITNYTYNQNDFNFPNIKIHVLNYQNNLPFKNLYSTPQTLGLDRIAAMAAVAIQFPAQNTLVFDLGTCITIDFLNANNEYLGGNISPGLNMRLKAMNAFTEKLPLSSIDNIYPTMGNSTLSAIANGAFYGIVNELNGYINAHETLYSPLNVVLCGGDTLHFDKQLKTKIFAQPNLVLEGLYQLLLLNENK